MTRKCLTKKKNSRNEVFALVDNGNATFTVLKLCENYDGKVRGGISKTWRYIGESKMNREAATELFNMRAGK